MSASGESISISVPPAMSSFTLEPSPSVNDAGVRRAYSSISRPVDSSPVPEGIVSHSSAPTTAAAPMAAAAV